MPAPFNLLAVYRGVTLTLIEQTIKVFSGERIVRHVTSHQRSHLGTIMALLSAELSSFELSFAGALAAAVTDR